MCSVDSGCTLLSLFLSGYIGARILRELSDAEIEWKQSGTRDYQRLAQRSAATMVETLPLTEIEEDRPRLDVAESVPLYTLKEKG